MKNTSLTLVVICCIVANNVIAQFESSKQVFESPNLESAKKEIKSVAVLPFNVVLSYKKMPRNMTVDLIKVEEEKSRMEFQQGLYTYLLRRQEKYSASIQNPDRTNALLRKAGILTKDDLEAELPDSLAKILQVDAIIKCAWNYSRTGTEGGAIAKAALGIGGSTGSGTLTLQVYNGKDGELLWRFYKEMNENVTSDANDTMERMMRKVGRNFPLENAK